MKQPTRENKEAILQYFFWLAEKVKIANKLFELVTFYSGNLK